MPLKTKTGAVIEYIRHEKSTHLKAVILIAAICLIAYANTFGNEFVWDDKDQIVKSVRLKNLESIPSAFTMGVWEFSSVRSEEYGGYYRPFFLLSLMGDYQLWGLNPSGYHLMNLLFHILSTILLYLIVHQILGKREVSLIAALLFAVHPVHTESVTFISGRADVLFLFFFLLSFYFYIKNRTKLGWVYTASVASFFIAMFSKEIAITLPIIIILYDICFAIEKIDRSMVKRLKYHVPFFAVAFLYLFIRFFILDIAPVRVEYPGGSLYTALLTMSTVFIRYILLLVAPLELTVEYAIPVATSILGLHALLSTLFLFALLALTMKMYKSNRLVFFSIAWFFITLLPVSNLLPQAYPMAERYLYLPSIGFCILAAVAIQKILDNSSQKKIKRIVVFCLILLLALYSVRTIDRNADWKDELTLWSETVKSSPYTYRVHHNLGMAYSDRGRYDEAISEFNEALRINPNYSEAYGNLGRAYAGKGMYDEAIAELKEALRRNPNNVNAHNNLGMVYFDDGMYDEAIAEYREALKTNPNHADVHYNLGIAYYSKGLHDEAMAEYKEALRINPDHAGAHNNLGNAYLNMGLYDEAIAEYEEALRINPNDVHTHHNLAVAYYRKGLYDEAIVEYKEALRIDPNYANVINNNTEE